MMLFAGKLFLVDPLWKASFASFDHFDHECGAKCLLKI